LLNFPKISFSVFRSYAPFCLFLSSNWYILSRKYFLNKFKVDVKWSASTRGRPSLPQWMHLIPSRHRSIAFLIGTPVSPHSHFPLHIIATRMDSFQSSEQSFSVVTNDDRKLIFNILN